MLNQQEDSDNTVSSVVTVQPSSLIDINLDQDLYGAAASLENTKLPNPILNKTSNTLALDQGHSEDMKRPQPSAPLDLIKVMIRVNWNKPFPKRWDKKVQVALQSWLSNQTDKHSIENMRVKHHMAEVVVLKAALDVLKDLKELHFKDENESVPAMLCPNEPMFEQKCDETEASSLKGKSAFDAAQMDVDLSADADKMDIDPLSDATHQERGMKETGEMKREMSSASLIVPFIQAWYVSNLYKAELEDMAQRHRVHINIEATVSFKPNTSSCSDSVPKVFEEFQKCFVQFTEDLNFKIIPHNSMDPEGLKKMVYKAQSAENKMVLSVSSKDYTLLGPKKVTESLSGETDLTHKSLSRKMEDCSDPFESKNYLDMYLDLGNNLEMDQIHWDLMNLSYKRQISQLEDKFGVQFLSKKKNHSVTMQAKSKESQIVNLESHAIRALTHLYQKLATAIITCELMDPSDAARVDSIIPRLKNGCVLFLADSRASRKLIGIRQELGPAIALIEATLNKKVFDEKTKNLIGYFGDTQPIDLTWNQMKDFGAGAVGGSDRESEGGRDERSEKSREPGGDEKCVICMDSFTNRKKLACGHEFCKECVESSMKHLGSICPVCKKVFGKLIGNQPQGTMTINRLNSGLPGYPRAGTIEIIYNIPAGVQTSDHPNPGMHFYGATRSAYLPDNSEGNKVLGLLQRAFDQKLIFTVGKSTTSGRENVVTWNDIHHKTQQRGGPLSYGYPDQDYLNRVKDELRAKGIE